MPEPLSKKSVGLLPNNKSLPNTKPCFNAKAYVENMIIKNVDKINFLII